MEINTTLTLLLEEVRKINIQLLERGKRQDFQPSPVEINQVPEHVDIGWITTYFGISKSTFYNSVKNQLLEPILYVGRRPYYLKSDVIKLMETRKFQRK